MAHPVQALPIIPWHNYTTLVNMPEGTYGLSYDISTLDTERDLPSGWNTWRGKFVPYKYKSRTTILLKIIWL
jgi:hypothetical protein